MVYVHDPLRPCWYTAIGAGLVTFDVLIELVVPLELAPPLKSVSATKLPCAELPQAILMPLPPLEDEVVTFTAPLWPDVPNESVAATVKLYVVDGERPVAVKVVPVDVPTDVPLRYTV